ncbi:hypothetical protein KCU71_g6917, partial [Aureobasidium melanogenum]
MKARLNLRDPFETTFIPSAGSNSHVIPETPPSSGKEAAFPTVEQENVFGGDRWVAPSRSLEDIMHKTLFTGALAASNKALASTERDGNPSDPRMKPLKLDLSSTEASIEVLVFKDSRDKNNTIDTATVNTNNEQSNKPTAHTSMKRKPPRKPLAPKNTMLRPGPHGKTSDNGSNPANENPDLPIDNHYLLAGCSGPSKRIVDDMINNLLNEAPRSTTPTNLTTHTAGSTSSTQTNTVNHTATSKVTKSNLSHIELFKTLSPTQKIGRRNKLNSIRNKLKEKTVDELTQIYNSTDDPGFRKLMSEVYYENCMERLDDWEKKL